MINKYKEKCSDFGNLDGMTGSCHYCFQYKFKLFEECIKEKYKDVKPKQKPKPPLGVTPKNIFEMIRVQDLTRALQDYAHNDTSINNYELMLGWAEELVERLEDLKFEEEWEEGTIK